MASFKPITESEVIAALPDAIEPIKDMNLREMIRAIMHMMHCAQAVQYEGHQLSFLYLACPASFWPNYSQDQYPVTPPHPGPFPTFPANATTGEIANLKSAWEWNMKLHKDPMVMDRCLINRFLSLVPVDKKKEYTDRRVGHLNETYLDCLTWFTSRYGMTSEPEREDNKKRMKAPWAVQDGWTALQTQLEEGQLYAALTNAPISDVDMVDMCISVLMDTQQFEHAYEEWHARPDGTKTWADAKTFCGVRRYASSKSLPTMRDLLVLE